MATTHRLLISGRVQGVGFRDWMAAEATALGVHGWVRNLRDGRVEALVHGDDAAVAELLQRCRSGPPAAAVADIARHAADPPDFARRAGPDAPGFARRPTG